MSSSSDSGPEDRLPPKKLKTESKDRKGKDERENKQKAVVAEFDEEGRLALGNNRFVSISTFKGMARVDIREFYNAGDGLKPGKKGISLSFDQFRKLQELMPVIDEKIKNM